MPILVQMTLEDMAKLFYFMTFIPKLHILATRGKKVDFLPFWRTSWLKWKKMNKTKKLHLFDAFLNVAFVFFIFSKERLQKRSKSRVHVFTPCECTWACAPTWTTLKCLGDQTWYMLKVWWRSEFNWLSYGYAKKCDGLMDKGTDYCQIYIRISNVAVDSSFF